MHISAPDIINLARDVASSREVGLFLMRKILVAGIAGVTSFIATKHRPMVNSFTGEVAGPETSTTSDFLKTTLTGVVSGAIGAVTSFSIMEEQLARLPNFDIGDVFFAGAGMLLGRSLKYF